MHALDHAHIGPWTLDHAHTGPCTHWTMHTVDDGHFWLRTHKADTGAMSSPAYRMGDLKDRRVSRKHLGGWAGINLFICFMLAKRPRNRTSALRDGPARTTDILAHGEFSDQSFYLIYSQDTDTWPTSPSDDPLTYPKWIDDITAILSFKKHEPVLHLNSALCTTRLTSLACHKTSTHLCKILI